MSEHNLSELDWPIKRIEELEAEVARLRAALEQIPENWRDPDTMAAIARAALANARLFSSEVAE